jgi:hypothetical protein
MPAFDERRHRQHFGRRYDWLATAPMDAQLEHGSLVAAAGAYGSGKSRAPTGKITDSAV